MGRAYGVATLSQVNVGRSTHTYFNQHILTNIQDEKIIYFTY